MFSIHEKRNELREIYLECLTDSETPDYITAKILLQELKTYPFVGKSRDGRHLFDEEKREFFIHKLAVNRLVNLINKGFDKNYFISINSKGEHELKKDISKYFI